MFTLSTIKAASLIASEILVIFFMSTLIFQLIAVPSSRMEEQSSDLRQPRKMSEKRRTRTVLSNQCTALWDHIFTTDTCHLSTNHDCLSKAHLGYGRRRCNSPKFIFCRRDQTVNEIGSDNTAQYLSRRRLRILISVQRPLARWQRRRVHLQPSLYDVDYIVTGQVHADRRPAIHRPTGRPAGRANIFYRCLILIKRAAAAPRRASGSRWVIAGRRCRAVTIGLFSARAVNVSAPTLCVAQMSHAAAAASKMQGWQDHHHWHYHHHHHQQQQLKHQ